MAESALKSQALAMWRHGQKHHLLNGLEHAIELYTKSLELYPTAEAYTFRGWAYSFQGRIDEAIEECMKAIAVDPTFGNPYNDIGSYLVKNGKLDDAIEWFGKAKTAPRYEPRHFVTFKTVLELRCRFKAFAAVQAKATRRRRPEERCHSQIRRSLYPFNAGRVP